MKKRCIQILFILAFFFSLSAYAAPLRWGIKAGPTLSLAKSYSIIYNPANLWGAKLGLFVAVPIISAISFQPESFFALKGARYYSAYWRHEKAARLNYLEISALLNIHILPETLEASVGPYFGFLLYSTAIDEDHDWTWRENRVSHSDFGLSTGLRYHILGFLFAELQWNWGWGKAVFGLDPSDRPPHRNSRVSLLLGYQR